VRSAFGLVLLVAPGPASADAPPSAPPAPPSLVAVDPIDHSLDPPPEPPRWAAKGFLLGGGVLLLGGFTGTLLSPYCATRDAHGDCVDPRGSTGVFPLMMAAGLVAGVVGAALWRQDVEAAP
jgi:hypothetical protein